MTGPIRSLLGPLFATGLGVLAVTGCSRPFVSPIAEPPYRNQAPASYDETWRALVRALQSENVPLRTVAKDSGVIASDDFVSPIGVYADCGRLGDERIEPLERERLAILRSQIRGRHDCDGVSDFHRLERADVPGRDGLDPKVGRADRDGRQQDARHHQNPGFVHGERDDEAHLSKCQGSKALGGATLDKPGRGPNTCVQVEVRTGLGRPFVPSDGFGDVPPGRANGILGSPGIAHDW
jgi:hypothetical protein